MNKKLEELIEAARRVSPTRQDREASRRSFAYGNTAYENERITREMIDRQADKLAESDVKRKA